MNRYAPTLLFFFLSLLSCQPEPRNMVPSDETYIYSGTFKAIQQPEIRVNGKQYDNEFGEAPIQITAEVSNDNLVFTLYGYDYKIYYVNFFIEHEECFEYNGTEYLDIKTDAHGNDEVRVIFPEDFWKRCYMSDDKEKRVSFILKSEKPIFQI